MEVILLEQVKKLGNTGDIVNVKTGFARNFLIPTKKAVRASKDNIAHFESKKKDIEKANAQKLTEAKALAKKCDDKMVSLLEQASEDGRLYGSVKASSVAKVISEELGEAIARNQVILHTPIKYIGIYEVSLDLHAELDVTIHVNVARTAAEAKDAASRFAKGETVMEGPESEEEEKASAEDAIEIQEPEEEEETEKEASSETEAKEDKAAAKEADEKEASKEEAADKEETKEEKK